MYPGSLLHVEDDDASAVLLRLALDEVGFTGSVYRVSNGEEALSFLRKSSPYQNARTPQLVVLDLNLPKRDGWDVLAEKRCDPQLKYISFVVMSTAPASQNQDRAVASGAVGYMEKGRDLKSLIEQAELLHQLYMLNSAVENKQPRDDHST